MVEQTSALRGENSPDASQPHASVERPERRTISVVDHQRNEYVIPWDLGKEWTQFHAFVKDIYERKGLEEHLSAICDDKFDVLNALGETIILPSVWGTFVQPGDTVQISLWDVKDEQPSSIQGRRTSDDLVLSVIGSAKSSEVRYGRSRSRSRRSRVRHYTPPEIRRTRSRSGSRGAPPTTRPRFVDYEEMFMERNERASSSDETDESEEESELPPLREPMRAVRPALDQDGNKLTFSVDLRQRLPSPPAPGVESNGDKSGKTRRDINAENLKITKAVIVETEGRTSIQIHTLPGPESSAFSSRVGIRWYHVHADMLDWAKFKTTCATLPELSESLQKVVRGTLHKVEKEKLKAFLGGMFIEPGTVLRGDSPTDSDAQSVIFSCIPHFDIREPISASSAARSEHLHPARSLMQAYYPYEPVRDRDEEQAYRKFGNSTKDNLIHVPSMWMMNIGSDVVVTCGYRPLHNDFVKSIEVVPEDIKQLGMSAQSNKLTSIRLTDWDQRVLLYSLDECRTYFEVERKLQELNSTCGGRRFDSLKLYYKTPKGLKKVTPKSWLCIVSQKKLIFIDLLVAAETETQEVDSEVTPEDCQPSQPALFTDTSVPPFFHWPVAATITKDDTNPSRFIPADNQRSIQCLEIVEKAIANEGVYKLEKIREASAKEAIHKAKSLSLSQTPSKLIRLRTYHEALVETHCSKFPSKTNELIAVVQETLKLFVSDLDNNTLLRKVWGVMANIGKITSRLSNMKPCGYRAQEYTSPEWKPPMTGRRQWQIRRPFQKKQKGSDVSNPGGEEDFVASIRKCRSCQRQVFNDPNAALEHLRTAHPVVNRKSSISTPSTSSSDGNSAAKEEKLKDWICNRDQIVIEKTLHPSERALLTAYFHTQLNVSLVFLNDATDAARSLHSQLKELADGVRDETSALAEIYTFPRKLVETFRRLIIFYFAVETGLQYMQHYYEASGDKEPPLEKAFEFQRRTVLHQTSEDVNVPLLQARENLCDMARSSTPVELGKRMSLSPEYICSWLMRRLIVKPLDKSMSIADMYREYFSTLQFQVNHRPGKRLLRSINLLQEELQVLSDINDWQTRLVANYMAVLDEATYTTDQPARRAMFPFERLVLSSCLDNLALAGEEYVDQIHRCGPLSDSTKQSAEINEEDHGKAILVFTVVTIIFLPLSFVTSYLGMNTSDIRDMDNTQNLFWEISIPLTAVVMGTILIIAYNGDELRDRVANTYRSLIGKQNQSTSARGISVAQRKRAAKATSDSASSTTDYKSLADEAEYASPKPEWTDPYFNRGGAQMQPTMRANIPTTTYAEADEWPIDIDAYGAPPLRPRRRTTTHLPMESRPRTRRTDAEFVYRTPHQAAPYNYASAPPPFGRQNFASRPSPYADYHASAVPLISSERPTWFRMHRKHIAPETLAHFALPWELDPKDDNYIIVKQWLSDVMMDDMFEHTRQLKMEEKRATRGWRGNGSVESGREDIFVEERRRRGMRRGREEELDIRV